MKKPPRMLVIIFAIFLFTNNSCKKNTIPVEPFSYNAIITGFDVRACVCCGGLMISFDGESKPYTGNFRLISNDPVDIGITQADTFPVFVQVDWKEDTTNVCNHILITKIAKR